MVPPMIKKSFILLAIFLAVAVYPATSAHAQFDRAAIEKLVIPPYGLGEKDPQLPVFALTNAVGEQIGYVFQSMDLIQIPGFSGEPPNLLIQMDKEGNFFDVRVLSHGEPVFAHGHGPGPLNEFLRQYAGLSVGQNVKVMLATQQADRKKNQIDGVAMATASLRIFNETILASALDIARKKIQGLTLKPAATAKPDLYEKKSWDQLLKEGLVKRVRFTNSDIQELFKGSDAQGFDSVALGDKDGLYTELFVADLSVPTIARNVLTDQARGDIFRHMGETKVPVLVLANGRHPLVRPDFVPASIPERLTIEQKGLPVGIRDGYAEVALKPGIDMPEQAMVFELDRRLGFDPGSAWTLKLSVVRSEGLIQPTIVSREIGVDYSLPARFFDFPKASEIDIRSESEAPWLESWRVQSANLIILLGFLLGLFWLLFYRQSWLALGQNIVRYRPLVLLFTLIFIGWYGQAQLSIVTVVALVKTLAVAPGLSFLLYDPLSTVLWGAVIISLFLWGRGTFCGWLCPYGVLQEFSYKAGKLLGIKSTRIPRLWDENLKLIKYVVLGGIVVTAIFWPRYAETVAEVEPFKTAITLYFWRTWPFMLYAAFWLVLSMFVFKGFCRYVCPLGAFLSLGGLLRARKWIPRRVECGSPCQLCSVKCEYQAIEKSGAINYRECFQCLDCVTIHDDAKTCVPLVLAARNNGGAKKERVYEAAQ